MANSKTLEQSVIDGILQFVAPTIATHAKDYIVNDEVLNEKRVSFKEVDKLVLTTSNGAIYNYYNSTRGINLTLDAFTSKYLTHIAHIVKHRIVVS